MCEKPCQIILISMSPRCCHLLNLSSCSSIDFSPLVLGMVIFSCILDKLHICSETVVPISSHYSLLPSHSDSLGFVHNAASADLLSSGGEGILAQNCCARMGLRALLDTPSIDAQLLIEGPVSLLLNQGDSQGSAHTGSVNYYQSGDRGLLPYYC